MARIDKGALTRLEIVAEASKQFLEKGYSSTTVASIAHALEMSKGNLTFYYPTKEHLLAEVVLDKVALLVGQVGAAVPSVLAGRLVLDRYLRDGNSVLLIFLDELYEIFRPKVVVLRQKLTAGVDLLVVLHISGGAPRRGKDREIGIILESVLDHRNDRRLVSLYLEGFERFVSLVNTGIVVEREIAAVHMYSTDGITDTLVLVKIQLDNLIALLGAELIERGGRRLGKRAAKALYRLIFDAGIDVYKTLTLLLELLGIYRVLDDGKVSILLHRRGVSFGFYDLDLHKAFSFITFNI